MSAFDRWWSRFARESAGEDPYLTAQRLRRKIRRTRVADRRAFLRHLWRRLLRDDLAFGVALFLLEESLPPEVLLDLARQLRPLPALQSDDEESHLADLIRCLAATGERRLAAPVEEYLLERAIGPHWASVPWTLWPRRRRLFARAWERYFVDVAPSNWDEDRALNPFLGERDAAKAVAARLAERAPERLERFREILLRRAQSVGWLSPSQRESLERALA